MSARRDWTHASDALRRPHRAEMAAWQPAYAERRADRWWFWLCACVVIASVAVIGAQVVRGLMR